MIDILLWVLSTYRLTIMVVYEDGPFDVFKSLRFALGFNPWFNKGINCPWCVSFWVSLVVMFLPYWINMWFAIAGGVAIVLDHTYREVEV